MPLAWAMLQAVPEAKVHTGIVRLSGPKAGSRWRYVNKFGYSVGVGTYRVRLRMMNKQLLLAGVELHLGVFVDEHWGELQAADNVCDLSRLADTDTRIRLRADGSFAEWTTGRLNQSERPHIWYFAVSDCNANGTFRLGPGVHRVRYEFEALQESGSQFSHEMQYSLHANGLCLLGFTILLLAVARRMLGIAESAGSVHPIIWTLCASMAVQYTTQAFHFMHLGVYSLNGRGLRALEVFTEMLSILAQVAQTSLLIVIALGYTLLQSKLGQLELMIPLCFFIGVVHIIIVGFAKIKDDAAYKFHENEGAVGWVLLITRMLMYAWFLWAVHSSSSAGGFQVQRFLAKFRLAGSAYFLSYPAIFLATKFADPSAQYALMSWGLMAAQLGTNLWLARLFLTRGDYFKVSTLSDSGLPGGNKVGLVKGAD